MNNSTADIGRALGLSPASQMVNGYSGQHRSLDRMDAVWNWAVLHPGMKFLELWLFFSDPRTVRIGVDADGLPILATPLGNGSSGRAAGDEAWDNFWTRWSRTNIAARPSRTITERDGSRIRVYLRHGYAPIAAPGTSNHERDTFENWCMATDAVGWDTHPWMGQNAHIAGLLTFWDTGNEPWHLQLLGYGKSKSALQRDLAARGFPIIVLPPIPLAAPPAPEPEPEPELPKERIMSDVKMGPPTTSPSRVHTPEVDKVTGVVQVFAVDPTNSRTLGAVGVDVVVEAKGIELDQAGVNGWMNCNGITVAALEAGRNTLIALPPMPVDEKGMLELVIVGAKCHLIVDRANHRPAVSGTA